MAMLHKWATGSHTKDNQKNDSAGNAVIEASGDFAYELPNSEPSEVADTVAAATTPYTLEKAKQYSATAQATPKGQKKKLEWYNLYRMVKWRKILKMRDKVGVNPDAPTTNLYEA